MGKPFESDIKHLPNTYKWACRQNVKVIADNIRTTSYLPLISVGSGGSYSAAELHSTLHRINFQSIAQAVTPMEMVSALPRNGNAALWFMSASGNNIDIQRSFKHAAVMEPKSVSTLVGRKGSKLAKIAARYQYTNLFEYSLPSGKDGFLATNSLFAFAIIMYRAYCVANNKDDVLPNTVEELVFSRLTDINDIDYLKDVTSEIWKKDKVHIIYSPNLKSIGIDIESKFIEAGLGSIHLSDLRNFAHGRHHWFAKNKESNGIICLTSPDDFDLGLKTLGLLPDYITKAHINIQGTNGVELLTGLLLSIYFTKWKGFQRSIDPGKPGVPQYGSKIYRLTANSGFIRSVPKEQAAIKRKISHGPMVNDQKVHWEKAYRKFVKAISKQRFGGVVLDYDGTVVDARNRKAPPTKEICVELTRLLDIGIKIGFATGRGKSIKVDLRKTGLIPEKYWHQILIGYYNGADISNLADDKSPNGTNETCVYLKNIKTLLNKNILVTSLQPEITERLNQITVEPKRLLSETFLWESVKDQLSYESFEELKVVRSSHSIDIITKKITKLSVVNKMREITNEGLEILTIGDRGRWPGNDVELLSVPFSLSVDEVSFSDDRCWNLCTAGVKGPQGTLEYLKRLNGNDGQVIFK